jgi:hypothetical protein
MGRAKAQPKTLAHNRGGEIMGAVKEVFIDMQDEMRAVARQLEYATEDGEPELIYDTLIECTAKLAVVTRRYHSMWSK